MGKPWVYDREKRAILDDDQIIISFKDGFQDTATPGLLRRITACVNFCHGIDSEQLERAIKDRLKEEPPPRGRKVTWPSDEKT